MDCLFYNGGMRVQSFDYRQEFKDPESGFDFHWWNQNKTSLHTHNYYEIFLITEGEVMHRYNNQVTHAKRNTLFFIEPGDVHQLEPFEDKFSQHINLSFTERSLELLFGNIEQDMLFKIHSGRCAHQILLNDTECNFLLYLANQLTSTQYGNKILAAFQTKQIIVNALMFLYGKSNTSRDLPDWMSELLSKISTATFMQRPVSDIYALSHYSQPRLLYYFQKYLGESIISYFTKTKLNYACNLLVNTNFTILDIASRLAFDSLSHFIKIFKKHTGMTPGEYRKKHQN